MAQPEGFTWPGGARAAVSFSFDDARPSQLDAGLPVLDRHGIRATWYVSLDAMLARAPEWKAAAARGHEIGNHTLTHPCSGNFPWARANALEDYTLARMEAELDGATARIRESLGVTPRTFAYPCGQTWVGREASFASYIPLVRGKFLAGRGFLWETHNDPVRCDLGHLAGFFSDAWPADRYVQRIEAAIEHGGWAVFAGHDVGDDGYQTTRTAALDALGGWLAANKARVWVATVAEAARVVRDARGGA